MTATPIPRTISLTLYANLDVSSLDELPPGRKPVKTKLVALNERQECYQWIKDKLKKNKQDQAFVICPLVEESETLESVKAATTEYDYLKKEVFADFNLGLIHGRMKGDKKDQVLKKMKQGEIDILVATPVVEVGIDIPQATMMIIEAANRFGLAQLHQLRGRIGRADQQAYCFLFSVKKPGKRLRAMEKYNDGMKLATIDLKIRGPGEIYGTKQHGFPDFKIASYHDLALIEKTRKAAQNVIATSSNLESFPQLKSQIKTKGKGLTAPN